MGVSATLKVQTQLAPSVWTDLRLDTDSRTMLRFGYGIVGNGPLARVASTGELQYVLRNDAGNTGGTQGWFSPSHPSKRSGWGFGNPTRVLFSSGAIVDRAKFTGKIRVIDPDAGTNRSKLVRVVAYDGIRDLAEADAREVAIQEGKNEEELVSAVHDSLDASAQPLARDFDAGVDVNPYAFDDLAGSEKALSVINDVVVSSLGMYFVKGDGTHCYRNRRNLAIATPVFSFDNDMHGLSVPSSLDRVYRRVRAKCHPKAVTATATDELYSLPAGTTIRVPAFGSHEFFVTYTDPNDRQTAIGGTAVVTVLVAGTHYSANSAADGSGANLTSAISPTLAPFGSTAKWTLVNTGGTDAHIRVLKIVGKAVRDPGPQTFQSFDSGSAADRPLDIDLRYQDDPFVTQSTAHYIRLVYGSLSNQIEEISFIANVSEAFMEQALLREPGDFIRISEAVTGLASVVAVIQSVQFEVKAPCWIVCRWGLAPASTLANWQWGIDDSSNWGESTVYGL